MLTGYLDINFYSNTYTTAVCEVCACVRGTGGRVCGGYLFAFAPVMLHVVLMLFQEINKHSYGRLCVLLLLLRCIAGAPRTEHYQLVRALSAGAVVTVL